MGSGIPIFASFVITRLFNNWNYLNQWGQSNLNASNYSDPFDYSTFIITHLFLSG